MKPIEEGEIRFWGFSPFLNQIQFECNLCKYYHYGAINREKAEQLIQAIRMEIYKNGSI